MHTPRARGFLVCLAGVVAVFGSVVPQLAQAHKKANPRITATPSVLAANETTTLEGTGFPADETIALRECAQKVEPPFKYPCNSPELMVETNTSGGFTATFVVTQCHGEKKLTRPQKCYVGDYRHGFDSGGLWGAVKLTVTP